MRVKSLDKKWKEFLFAFSGFGPNLLMVLMGAYFTDAINPVALADGSFQAISSGVCFILPAIFPILHALGKVFDGIIDIPFAHITDSLSTKWGRRRPAIAVCILPMIISFALCWLPIGGAENPLLNTIWIAFWELIFFATYTMCLIAFYGSLSSVCESEAQRLRVSGYKSFFDTISYCLVYALVPLLLDVMQINIDKFVFLLLPTMLTMAIPLFIIKEGEKYGYPEKDGLSEEKVTLKESLILTFKNKTFLNWLLVNCCTFFGLQMFLVGMNAMIIGGMGFNGTEMALVNTCAFAPVPIMLYLFNKLKAKKGIRFTYQTCLVAFGVAILSFFFASTFVMGTQNKIFQYLIACVGGVLGSWAIGSFFMMPYMISAQISAVEEKITKKNHSAMYFAANAVVTSIVGAISGSLVYENIKMLFISKNASGIVWAENFTSAAQIFSQKANAVINPDQVFNFGTLTVPFIVCAVCILGAILAQRMPKDYTPYLVAKELKKHNPDLDISNIEQTELCSSTDEKGEIIFVQVGLSILSGFIFGFIWLGYLLKSIKELTKCKCNNLVKWLICSLIPFANIYFTVKMHEQLNQILLPNGKKATGSTALFIILGILFPILPINVVCLSLLQSSVNKAYSVQEDCKVANLTGAIEA